jgi:hypothetical protein
MSVVRYKNPSDYAFLEWMGMYPESHHPLDTERFYVFVKTVARFRNQKWRNFDYFEKRVLEHKPHFDKAEIEHFWSRMQEMLCFYQVSALPSITSSLDERSGIYQRGVKNGIQYEVQISEQEYYGRKGASAETLKNVTFFDDKTVM